MKKMPVILSLFLILISFISCSNSYDSMLDQFNRKYFSAEPAKEEPYSVKSSKFVASEMLSATYTVPENVYLNLEAPDNADFYLWTYEKEDGSSVVLGREKNLMYKTPGLMKVREENDLVLTVKVADENGNLTEYIDKTIIIIKKSQTTSDNGGV